jgi:hypothetical protein
MMMMMIIIHFFLLDVGEGGTESLNDPHVADLSIIIRACIRIDSRLISPSNSF